MAIEWIAEYITAKTIREMRMLNGLFDIDNRLEYLTENGDILPNLKKLTEIP